MLAYLQRSLRILLLAAGVLFSQVGGEPAMALSRPDVYRILADEFLLAAGGSTTATIRLYPQPLSGGVISPRNVPSPVVDILSLSGNPQWFAFVDYSPCHFFPHPADFAFIDDVTGVVTTFPVNSWPDLNYETLGASDVPGEQFIRIASTVSYDIPVSDATPAAGLPGDYGDAPEGVAAYPGGVLGRFPTYAASTNGFAGRPGARATTTGFEMIGTSVSVEADLNDPGDVDGRPNQLDGDLDDGFYVIWDPNTVPATGHLLLDVTVSSTAPAGPRYLNVVMDFDRDGGWSSSPGNTEWVVQNQAVSVAPGTTEAVLTTAFNWSASDDSIHIWTRVLIDRSGVDPVIFDSAGWDGSGVFEFGEIEDAAVLNTICRPSVAVVDSTLLTPLSWIDPLSPASSPGRSLESLLTFDRSARYVRVGPVRNDWGRGAAEKLFRYQAIVVQGMDNPKEAAAEHSARQMAHLLERMGMRTTHLKRPKPIDITRAIDDWISEHPRCEWLLYVYLVGHSGGGIRQLILRDEQDPAQLAGNRYRIMAEDLAGRYALLPPCEAEGEDCSTWDRQCDITTIIDVCNAGSWEDTLKARGRRVLMSCGNGELAGYNMHLVWPSWLISHESYYSQEFVKAALVSAQGNATMATAREIHQVATPKVKLLGQNPTENLDACQCRRPPRRIGHHCVIQSAPIVSGQLTVVEIDVPETFPIMSCEFELAISHERTEDLHVVLRHPDGTGITLASGLQGHGFVDVLFADDGTTPVPAEDGIYYGHFNPVDPFSSLVDRGSQGVWRLEITDAVPGVDGEVEWACLYMNPSSFAEAVDEPGTHTGPGVWEMGVRKEITSRSWEVIVRAPSLVLTSNVDVRIFDLSGRLISSLHSGPLSQPELKLRWDGTNERGQRVPAGIYFLKLSDGGQTRAVRKVLVVEH